MKKQIIIIFNLLLLVILCGCSSSVYTVEVDGKTYEVNHETNTIYDGKFTYEFEYSGDSTSYNIDIKYPNGAIYSESKDDDATGVVAGTGYNGEGFYESGSKGGYESGSKLCYLVTYKNSKTSPAVKILSVIFLFGLGIFNIVAPEKAWMLQEGWRFNNVEPSDMRLAFNVLIGVFIIILGIVVIFI